MPKITAASIALTALLIVTLTGCSAPAQTPASAPADAAQQTASQTPAPLVAESTEPLTAETPSQDADADAKFVKLVRDNLISETQIPNATDAQLIAAGHDACDQLAAGAKPADVRVVDGEKPFENGIYYDSNAIVSAATQTYCIVSH